MNKDYPTKIGARDFSPGLLVGCAERVISRDNLKSGQPFEGLRGRFLFRNAATGDEKHSTTLFINDDLHSQIAKAVKEKEADQVAEFAVAVEQGKGDGLTFKLLYPVLKISPLAGALERAKKKPK